MNFSEYAYHIVELHHQSILQWKKKQAINCIHTHFFRLVEENHAFNYQLWHTEDKARRDDMGFEFVYHAKRDIDTFNQQRNNKMEEMDDFLFHALQPAPANTCPIHSETPGMMIDRLSILALKAYFMEVQVQRKDAPIEHQILCQSKLDRISAQKNQLQTCLHNLFVEVSEKTRTFCIYRQFKMYNDPALNPELYQTTVMPLK